MGYIEGLLGGFTDRKREVEKENIRQSDLASQRETAILSHLMTADDPDIRSAAVTGLLDSASPKKRKGGIAGWMGEMQDHPAFGKIRSLMDTPVTETQVTPGAAAPNRPLPEPSQLPGFSSTPDGPIQPQITGQPAGNAGMPQQSPVTGGPPPAPGGYGMAAGAGAATTPPPSPRFVEQAPTVTTTSHPRQIFRTPDEQMYQTELAKNRAEMEIDDARVKRGLPSRFGSRASLAATAGQHVAIETPDGTQRMAVFRNGQYLDPDTNEPFAGAMPLQRAASTTMGVQIEPLAKAIYGKRGTQLSQPEMATLLEVQQLQKGQLKPGEALSHAERLLPNGTIEQRYAIADALMQGTHVAGGAGSTAGRPPAPATGTPPATTSPASPQASRLGAPPPGLGTATAQTGKPVPPAIQTAIVRTQAMNDNIDKALAALEPYKNDTSLEGTMKLVGKYRAGTEADPFALAAAQLPDLAGLQQSASATLGGTSRSQRIYADKRQHTPRLPSGRQIMFAHSVPGLNADRVAALSQMKEGDGGGFDSPAQMYQKLVGLRDANIAFLKDTKEAAGVGAPPVPAGVVTAETAKPGEAYKDASGVWHIKQ